MHVSVLYDEIMRWLQPRPGERYIDGTLGGAGHAEGILRRSAPDGMLLGLDADPDAVARAKVRLAGFGSRAVLIHANFADMEEVAAEHGFVAAAGILLDLGLSSYQLEQPERGFSFSSDGPLDMRLDPEQDLMARDLVNDLDQDELADLLWELGGERRARRIARLIAANRPIKSTAQLAGLVCKAYRRRSRIHPATRTFQALRMAVNDELGALRRGLEAGVNLLAPGGRLAVISFHSGEDRVVKRFMRREASDCICPADAPICICGHRARVRILTKKPATPSEQEVARNPQSRSAKLRVAAKI